MLEPRAQAQVGLPLANGDDETGGTQAPAAAAWLTYVRLALSVVALPWIVVLTVRHPSGRVAPAVFVSILLISTVILAVLRVRLDRQQSTPSADR